MKKIVVVTALIGAYDSNLIDFVYDRNKYEFICYTNMKRLKSNTWNIIYVDDLVVPTNNAKSSYWYKWNPHLYLDHNKYDYMVWMDSSFVNINMLEFDKFMDRFLNSSKALMIEKHPSRHSLQAELDANIQLNKDTIDIMRNQVTQYFNNGYSDKNTVMVETGLSFRKYKDTSLIKFSEAIWDEMCGDNKTKRDQLVYDYCMWKTNFHDYELFTFQEKVKVIMFQDHPNRPTHKEKVLLVGPWLGEDKYEQLWADYVADYINNRGLVDTVIVGCRPDREYLYSECKPDRFALSNPDGVRCGNLLNGQVPRFNVSDTSDDKEIIQLSSINYDTINTNKKIHILWSTIRPLMFNAVYKEWLQLADFKRNIVPHILVESEEDKNKIDCVSPENIIVYKSMVKGVALPSYILSSKLKDEKLNDDDIVIFASDDFYPMNHWDTVLYKEYSIFNGGLVVNDKNGAQNKDIVTIPIMSYDTLKKLNHVIYHPAYNHCWSDNELHLNLKEMDLLKDISVSKPEIYFEHRHFNVNKRTQDTSDEHNSLTHYTGLNIWKLRKDLPLHKRLEVDLNTKFLSILILTIPGREHYLDRLMGILNPQLTSDVEILIEYDNRELEIGEKRNKVLDRAKGRYVCYIDDDDRVSETYISDILSILLNTDVDCCSLVGEITIDGGVPQKFIHSLKYEGWFDEGEGADKVYYRNPNHLNVIKREIAKMIRFKDNMSHGEDADFSERIKGCLSVQGELNNKMYFYDAISNK